MAFLLDTTVHYNVKFRVKRNMYLSLADGMTIRQLVPIIGTLDGDRLDLLNFVIRPGSGQSVLSVFKNQQNYSKLQTSDTLNSQELCANSLLLTHFANYLVNPSGNGNYTEEDYQKVSQNAGMSIEYILQRFAKGQSVPVGRAMRADSSNMSEAEMLKAKAITDKFEATEYIRTTEARNAENEAKNAQKTDIPEEPTPTPAE